MAPLEGRHIEIISEATPHVALVVVGGISGIENEAICREFLPIVDFDDVTRLKGVPSLLLEGLFFFLLLTHYVL
jgi:hypothetical protein